MDLSEREAILLQTKLVLAQMREFDPNSIAQREKLGTELNFLPAVPVVRKWVSFYAAFDVEALDGLPDSSLRALRDKVVPDMEFLARFAIYKANDGPSGRHDLIRNASERYDAAFQSLNHLVSYQALRALDFPSLVRASDQASQYLIEELTGLKAKAEEIVASTREAAAETAVAQHARHFNKEAEGHRNAARAWLSVAVLFTVALLAFAFGSLAFRDSSLLKSSNSFETAQVVASKTLIFATLSFFLVFAARSYQSNRHNVVVNRHRQNALATYTALVNAAGADANRDIILTKAAECIFAAQPTDFSKADGADSGHVSLVTLGQGALK